MDSTKEGFLSEPTVTFDREGDDKSGRVVSAYLELRQGIKAVRTVQPNSAVLVYFLVAEDGLPIGISFHEPVSGWAVCELVAKLIEGAEESQNVDKSASHPFITVDDVRSVVRGVGRSLEGLQTA
ncbi:MAG: hypothetical protein ACYS0E_16755 [Planctomycetota bacterium]|jgi:hypothetical protein